LCVSVCTLRNSLIVLGTDEEGDHHRVVFGAPYGIGMLGRAAQHLMCGRMRVCAVVCACAQMGERKMRALLDPRMYLGPLPVFREVAVVHVKPGREPAVSAHACRGKW
jgi:hypothetical protein